MNSNIILSINFDSITNNNNNKNKSQIKSKRDGEEKDDA